MAKPKQTESTRRGVHLSMDSALYDDLQTTAELTGIRVSRIVDQGARLRLDEIHRQLAPVVEEAEKKVREKRRGGR